MKENLCKNQKGKRVLAGLLSITLLFSSGHFPFSMQTEARSDHLGNTDTYWSSTWHYYCIDHSGIAANGHGADGDLYQAFAPQLGFQVRRQHCFSGRHCPWRPVLEICLPSTSVISRSMRKQRLMVSGSCHQR